jgi:hypothetical protein
MAMSQIQHPFGDDVVRAEAADPYRSPEAMPPRRAPRPLLLYWPYLVAGSCVIAMAGVNARAATAAVVVSVIALAGIELDRYLSR